MESKGKFDAKKSSEVVDKILKSDEPSKHVDATVVETPSEEPKKAPLDLATVLGEHPEGHVKEELAKLVEQKAVIMTPDQISEIVRQAAAAAVVPPKPKSSKWTTGLKIAGSALAVGAAVVGGVYLYKYLSVIEPLVEQAAAPVAEGVVEVAAPVIVATAA